MNQKQRNFYIKNWFKRLQKYCQQDDKAYLEGIYYGRLLAAQKFSCEKDSKIIQDYLLMYEDFFVNPEVFIKIDFDKIF